MFLNKLKNLYEIDEWVGRFPVFDNNNACIVVLVTDVVQDYLQSFATCSI